MVLKCENHDLLVEKQFMHLIHRHPKKKTPLLYFMGAQYFPLQVMKEKMKWRKNNTCKLEMDFKCENHELLVQ